MNVEELRADLDHWDKHHGPGEPFMRPFVEAARLVADGKRALVVSSLWIEGERQLVLVLEDDIDPAEGTPFYLVTPQGDTQP